MALAAHGCVLPPGSAATDATVHTGQAGSANHSGTTPALFKLQSGDGALVSAGQIIWTKSGTGAEASTTPQTAKARTVCVLLPLNKPEK